MSNSRVKKTIKNAKVSLLFYFLLLIATFVSRGVVIKYLGTDFVGLTSTMMNIMGFFNLAEMGFSSVIAFALYKPLYERDEIAINEILSLYGHIYNRIGYIILFSGIILSIFIIDFFKESGFTNQIILATFFTYLITTLLGFFINYKEVLLAADQKIFVKIKLFNIIKIIKISTQLLCLIYLSKTIYAWLFLEFFFLTIYSYILNIKIRKLYPSLSTNVKTGKTLSKKYGFIYSKAKQAFFHKACALVLQQTSGILIYIFSNLEMVTKYTNYTLITTSVLTLISSVFDSTNAAVGNLVAEKNSLKILKVYWELQVSRFWIASCAAYITYTTIDLFISAWLGDSFLLPNDIKVILVLIQFIMIVRKTNDEFISACGLYKDTWAPITEAVINITIAVTVSNMIGITSVPLGALVSLFLIVGIWKPIFLYLEFLPEKLRFYVFRIFKYLLITAFSLYLVNIIPVYSTGSDNKYIVFISLATQKTLTTFLITGMAYYITTKEMRSFVKRFTSLLFNKIY